MKQEYSAGAVIYRWVNQKLEYLVVENAWDGSWGFSKGHLEGKETEKDAAKREIKEELGLEPKFDFKFKTTITYSPFPAVVKDVTYFVAKYDDSQTIKLQKEEISSSKWIHLEEAREILKYPALINVIKKADAYLKNEISSKIN